MKLAKILLASVLVSSCAFAQGTFVGVQGGYNFKTKVHAVENDADANRHNSFLGVKGGYDFGAFRTYAQYNYNIKFTESNPDASFTTTELSVSGHEILLGADWTPSLSENLKLAVGPYAGLSLLKVTDKDADSSDSKTEKGFIVGGKVGVIYDFGGGEFEVGFKADKSWHNGDDDWVDIDKTSYGAYIGYNFKF